MGNDSGHQCKVKMSAVKNKVNENTYDVVVVQNNVKEMNKKKYAARAELLFLLITPIVVCHRRPALPSPLSITPFYILFEKNYKYNREPRI